MKNEQVVLKKIIDNIEKVIIGKRRAVELMVIALICEGHLLIEDVPGVGKTTMVSALAKSLGLDFKRIQFTPDILPSDITGLMIYDSKKGKFRFHPGAVMTNILLADEINRTSPKTQSSLLEAMQERQITIEGISYELPKPFMVLATQNPIEYIGTFPLPEAQLDRFFMKITIGYPSFEEEMKILSRAAEKEEEPLEKLEAVTNDETICAIQQQVKTIHIDQTIYKYILEIVTATREHPDIMLGVSPRAALALLRSTQAWALYQGRDYVIPDDVKLMVPHVLAHRIILKAQVGLEETETSNILEAIVASIKVPIK